MTLDQQIEQLASQRYPRQVDVVAGVMAAISGKPLPKATRMRPLWPRLGAATAAAVVVFFVVGITIPRMRSYDNEGMSSMIAQLNDYGSWNAIEDAVENPYEYIYE